MPTDLQPCPFCKLDLLDVIASGHALSTSDPYHEQVACQTCGAMGPWGVDRDHAVERWNEVPRG